MREPETPPPERRISRRVVIGGIIGTAALAVGGASVIAFVDRDDDAHAGDRSGSGSGAPDSTVRGDAEDAVRRVGRRYLDVVPAEHDESLLTRKLRAAGVDPDDLVAGTGLRDAAKRDYGAGAVLLLDGWLVSRTEGRYAALIALRS